MIRLSTDKGAIAVDSSVYTNIAGVAASNCFGVKGMAVRSMTDGLVHLLRREAMSKGVRVTFTTINPFRLICTLSSTTASTSAPWATPSLTKSAMSLPNRPVRK